MAVKDTFSNTVKPGKEVKSVAIIGGGASGAIALDVLLKEGVFEKITVFERRDKLGGIWAKDDDYGETTLTPGSSEKDLDPALPVPEKLKSSESKLQLVKNSQERYEKSPAIYDSLRTNIPERIMTFSDNKKFPYLDKPDQDELTTMNSINQYINEYFEKNLSNTKVTLKLKSTIEEITKDEDNNFELVVRQELDDVDEWSIAKFDAVIISTGHYHVPFIPNVPGIHEVFNKFPGKIIHVKGFNKTEQYKGSKVIVIGGRASAVDTVRELKKIGCKDLVWSIKELDESGDNHIAETTRKPMITKYEITESEDVIVHFQNGTKLTNPDKIIYATGYQFSYPFLQKLDPNITSNSIIPNIYQHTFHLDQPLLTFIGIPINGITFRVFEYQAILISRFYAGKISLPSLQEQLNWRDTRLLERTPRDYHNTGLDPPTDYFDKLVELGGGYEFKDTKGRQFPVFTDLDLQYYDNNRIKLHTKWASL